MLKIVPMSHKINYAHERFPGQNSEFTEMFRLHGLEVRGTPFDIDWNRYYCIEAQKRLVWVVARDMTDGHNEPIGYSCHWAYQDINFIKEWVGCDGIWFVRPEWRNQGIGAFLKKMGHNALKELGAVRTSDVIRSAFDHPNLMANVGFERKGVKWMREL